MGLISSTHSMSRYHIEGSFEAGVMDEVRRGLTENAMPKQENEYEELSAGWTPYESPYNSDFEKFSFIFGTYFLFSLRIDKKSIPAKLVQKEMALAIEKKKKNPAGIFYLKMKNLNLKKPF